MVRGVKEGCDEDRRRSGYAGADSDSAGMSILARQRENVNAPARFLPNRRQLPAGQCLSQKQKAADTEFGRFLPN